MVATKNVLQRWKSGTVSMDNKNQNGGPKRRLARSFVRREPMQWRANNKGERVPKQMPRVNGSRIGQYEDGKGLK